MEGESSEEGREEKGLKGSEEERKRLVRACFFWGTLRPVDS